MKEELTLSGCAQARMIASRKISSAELIQAHLDRIAEINPTINAVVEVLEDSALLAAGGADDAIARGDEIGPFHGVPFSIKDSIEVAGTVCSAGTLGRRNAPPSIRDATLVTRIRAAGGIPLARTNLPDLLFAFETDNLIFGRSNNPHDLSRTPGGSSGGEAALIAACGSPFGLGSDCAGSVRVPAHFCGIAAIKPTSGRLSRTGHVPPAGGWIESLWQIGPLARHVEDLEALMRVLPGPDAADRTVVPMPYGPGVSMTDLRIAWFTNNGIVDSCPEIAAAVRRATECLAGEVKAVKQHRPPGIEQTYELEMMLLGADGGDGIRRYLEEVGSDRTHRLLEGWMEKLQPYRASVQEFAEYWARLDQFRACMFSFLNDYDAILSPVAPFPALPHGTSVDERNFSGFSYTMTYNLTGWPAAVVKCGETAEGLPIGVQIAAHPWREDVALSIAARLAHNSGSLRTL